MLGVFTAGERMARSLRLCKLASGVPVIEAQVRVVGGRLRRLGGAS